jgi:hypothetical protein
MNPCCENSSENYTLEHVPDVLYAYDSCTHSALSFDYDRSGLTN